MSDEEIKTAFAARQREQRGISYKALAVVVIGMGAAYLAPCAEKTLIYLILIAYLGFALYRTFKIWRCPACNRLLGDRLDLDACPRCSVKLK